MQISNISKIYVHKTSDEFNLVCLILFILQHGGIKEVLGDVEYQTSAIWKKNKLFAVTLSHPPKCFLNAESVGNMESGVGK